MEQYKKSLSRLPAVVKDQKPLVHHITNFVTANDCANVVLALGGSPVMADDQNEVEEMVIQASSLVLNIGTLHSETLGSMIQAGRKANGSGIPVILDPVGASATQFRTRVTREILEKIKISVLRGNMSEIKVLAGMPARTRGVDSMADFRGGQEAALYLSQKYCCTVAVTGEKDIISNGSKTFLVENGHEMLTRITGTGCMTTSLVATYCGVTEDYFLSALAGVVTMGLSGEKASQEIRGIGDTGTFKMKLFDAIANFTPYALMEGVRFYAQ